MDAAKVRLTIPQGIDPALVTGGGGLHPARGRRYEVRRGVGEG